MRPLKLRLETSTDQGEPLAARAADRPFSCQDRKMICRARGSRPGAIRRAQPASRVHHLGSQRRRRGLAQQTSRRVHHLGSQRRRRGLAQQTSRRVHHLGSQRRRRGFAHRRPVAEQKPRRPARLRVACRHVRGPRGGGVPDRATCGGRSSFCRRSRRCMRAVTDSHVGDSPSFGCRDWSLVTGARANQVMPVSHRRQQMIAVAARQRATKKFCRVPPLGGLPSRWRAPRLDGEKTQST